MEIKSITSKLVKPLTPTPSNLQNYDISFFDEQMPNINTPLILYYSASQKSPDDNIFNHLETPLSKTLVDFYPLAGRYMRQGSFVDCSDQGVLYMQSIANFQLEEFLGQAWELKFKMLNDLLPCEVPEAGEVDDPLLCIKVSTFECGGFAIGMCFSHKISDMCTMCTFINNWVTRSSQETVNKLELEKYSPIFSIAQDFPKVALDDLSPRFPRSNIGMETKVKLFQFKVNAISKMRENLQISKDKMSHLSSKVQLIVALFMKALMAIDKAKIGHSKPSIAQQGVNLRDKVVPKLPGNLLGNFISLLHGRIEPEEGENMDLDGFLMILNDSIMKIKGDYAKALMSSDKHYEVLVKPYLKFGETLTNNDVNFYSFTSWCKFSFYKVDFGWGKPVWRSTGHYAAQKVVILMDDEEGDGVEAWVHLDEKSMYQLEQNPDIKAYAT